MSKKFTVAIVQFNITHLKPEVNINRAEKFIAKAAGQGANVIVFPEDFMTGSIFGDLRHLDRDKNFLKKFQALARKYKIDIVSGSWMEKTKNGAFSTTNYIDSKGKLLGEYHKNHLYLSERKFLSPGTEVAVFDTAYGRTGLIICWDIMFPEIFNRMKNLGVQVVYCPSYWYKEITGVGQTLNPKAEEAHLDALCITRAVENNIIFIYANAAGVAKFPDGSSDTLVGHSQVAVPILGALIKLENNSEDMVIQSVDLSVLEIANEVYKLNRFV